MMCKTLVNNLSSLITRRYFLVIYVWYIHGHSSCEAIEVAGLAAVQRCVESYNCERKYFINIHSVKLYRS